MGFIFGHRIDYNGVRLRYVVYLEQELTVLRMFNSSFRYKRLAGGHIRFWRRYSYVIVQVFARFGKISGRVWSSHGLYFGETVGRLDSGQGTNSAVGDAVIDGGSIKWEYFSRFHDNSDEETEKIAMVDFENFEYKRMERNV